ncbi:MAG: hypothetical protein WB709_09790 [Solirubrobacteraceae bacterium]
MIEREDIKSALEALRRGQTGASVRAISRQPALMALQDVVGRAKQKSGGRPTNDQIARACQEAIADACARYANEPDDPEAARLLIGVAQGAKSVNLETRRGLVERFLEMKHEKLTHRRRDRHEQASESYETLAISAIAEALADVEENYEPQGKVSYAGLEHLDYLVGPSTEDFLCLEYEATVKMADWRDSWVTIIRYMKLLARHDGIKTFSWHDGWESAKKSLQSVQCYTDAYKPAARFWHEAGQFDLSFQVFDFGSETEQYEEVELSIESHYELPFMSPGDTEECALGFFSSPAGATPGVSLEVYPVSDTRDIEDAAAEIPDYGRFKMSQFEEGRFGWSGVKVEPGNSYCLYWKYARPPL